MASPPPVALVTGASRGLGAALAHALAARGFDLVLCARHGPELQRQVKQLTANFPKARILAATIDLAAEKNILRLFKKIDSFFGGRIDLLVNNAATLLNKNILETTQREWDAVLNVNLRAPFLVSRETARRMRRKKIRGTIVNISSLAGIRSAEKFAGFSAYVASKSGLSGLTESLAQDLKAYGIRVFGVAPGAINTEMLRKASPRLKSQTSPAQMAELIATLAVEKSMTLLSGSVIEVNTNA